MPGNNSGRRQPGNSAVPSTVGRLGVDGFWMWEVCVCFITAGPITKLCAWGEEESGGHML